MAISFRKSLPVILMFSAAIAFYALSELYERNKEKADIPSLITSDYEGIVRGRKIFDSKCRFCHDAYSTETLVGPGLKGILKKERLPFSNRPSTPQNILRQLRKPVDRMPAFEYLSEKETSDLLAFLYGL